MRHFLLALLVLLPACAEQPQRADGEVRIVWNQVDEPHKVCEGLSGKREVFQILGCSKWTDAPKPGGPRTCNVYVPRPNNERDTQRFATLGHEVMHCFEGNWHDRWGHMLEPGSRVAQNRPDRGATGGTASSTSEKAAAD